VNLSPDVKQKLELDWDEGEIVAIAETGAGLAAHILHVSTGQITPALRLEGLTLNGIGLRAYRNIVDTLAGKK
jgi:hypothetical protein